MVASGRSATNSGASSYEFGTPSRLKLTVDTDGAGVAPLRATIAVHVTR
jgi:hypothetical protein